MNISIPGIGVVPLNKLNQPFYLSSLRFLHPIPLSPYTPFKPFNQFSIILGPSGVMIDSGWNCTP